TAEPYADARTPSPTTPTAVPSTPTTIRGGRREAIAVAKTGGGNAIAVRESGVGSKPIGVASISKPVATAIALVRHRAAVRGLELAAVRALELGLVATGALELCLRIDARSSGAALGIHLTACRQVRSRSAGISFRTLLTLHPLRRRRRYRGDGQQGCSSRR